MPMFIPAIIAFAAVGSGAVVGFAAYATVAGAVLSTVGALTGNKDLQRIGAVVGVVGGIAGFANSAGSAASAASAASDAAVDASVAGSGVISGSEVAAGGAVSAIPAEVAASAASALPSTAPPTPVAGVTPADAVPTVQPTTALSDIAAKTAGPTATPMTTAAPTTPADALAAQTAQQASPLAKAASNYSASDLSSWWDKAMAAGKTVGKGALDFSKQNPELIKIGGQMLMSLNDPQAEALELQRSLMEQARRNINTPVVLGYNKPK